LSWLQAAACVGTVALLLRRGSVISAVLAILAVPLIAIRTGARADIFTVVLFAAFLSLLWQQHQAGRARLWLLPILMVAWVNLHLGFDAGLVLMAGYAFVEASAMVWPEPAARPRAEWQNLVEIGGDIKQLLSCRSISFFSEVARGRALAWNALEGS